MFATKSIRTCIYYTPRKKRVHSRQIYPSKPVSSPISLRLLARLQLKVLSLEPVIITHHFRSLLLVSQNMFWELFWGLCFLEMGFWRRSQFCWGLRFLEITSGRCCWSARICFGNCFGDFVFLRWDFIKPSPTSPSPQFFCRARVGFYSMYLLFK